MDCQCWTPPASSIDLRQCVPSAIATAYACQASDAHATLLLLLPSLAVQHVLLAQRAGSISSACTPSARGCISLPVASLCKLGGRTLCGVHQASVCLCCNIFTCAARSCRRGHKLSTSGFLKFSEKLQGSRCMLWVVVFGGLHVRVWMKLSSGGALVSSCAMTGVFLYVSCRP